MNTEDWEQVKRLFGDALGLDAGECRPWLERTCANPAIQREVLHLLEEYSRSEDFLENPTLALHSAIEEALGGDWEGRRIGSWRLVREIGRGGMGVVFEALREGEGFQTRFALKLIRAGFVSRKLAEQFRQERRLLAGLSHPGIAALIDGGATPEGLPYLVMEFVDGIPLDRWLRERQPSLQERIRLMISICDAVRHAHQHLVIHRDLKPANILVTADGRPKLLDFGIAKLLSEEPAAGADHTATYVLTPEYASPEQITGGPVTTATDIYSLGVMLYVTLAGRRHYDVAGLSPLEAMRLVLEAEPKAPSAVAPTAASRLLRGDLDNIVMQCLRKQPAARYRSADALARDLQAWLEGKPVSATPPSVAYRLGKWARRNRGLAVAFAALLLSLLAGGLATAWQAREARLAQRRAEQRALEIQKLSRSLVFEINEALQKAPGSTSARALLLDRAMQFLDGSARTASQDAALLVELAEGYRRLGNVLGSAFSDNLGRQQEAMQAFRKGLAAVEAARRLKPPDFALLQTQSGLLVEAGLAAAALEDRADAESLGERLENLTGEIQALQPAPPEAASLAAINWSQLAMIRGLLGQRSDTIRLYRKALALFDSLPPDQASSRSTLSQKAFALKRLGAQLITSDPAAAESHYERALAIDRELLRRNPRDESQRYNMTFALSDLGLISKSGGNYQKSLAYFSEAAAIRDEFYAADPQSVRILQGAVNVHCQKAAVLARLSRFHEAGQESAACLDLARKLAVIEGERGCGRPAAALLFAAEVPLFQAAAAQGARRARLTAQSDAFVEKARSQHQACTVAFAPFPSKLEELQGLRARLLP